MATETKKVTLQFDRETLAAVLVKIDPSLTTETLNSLIKAAGSSESAAIKSLFGQVNQLVLGGRADIGEADLEAIIKGLDAAGAGGKLVSLAGTDSAKLASMAGSDIGARYALIHGLSFAITGNPALYDNLNRDGSLFKFDPNTGEKLYTDEWLKDRAQFLAVKFNAGGEASLNVSGTQSWTFEERGGGASHIQVNADQNQRASAKMIFASGTNETQTIVGSASGDHIYSGAGDDNISTGAGDDYVEGGAGGDMIDGGRGNDTLLGGLGDDQLDGNVGDDKLFGGAGADYLVGGNGNDRLDGGSGFDTYVIDSGDGADTIVDADGQGEIILDGQALTGATTFQDGKYTNGKFTYSFAGDPEEGGVLVISSDTGSMKLVNFKNGALGITLGDGTSSALLNGGIGNKEILDLWGGNKIIDIPFARRDPIVSSPNPDPSGEAPIDASSNFATGASNDAQYLASVNTNSADAPTAKSAPVALAGEYAALFTDPLAEVPLLTGEHIDTAINLARADNLGAAKGSPVLTRAFGSAGYFQRIDFTSEIGVNPRQIEYALMDFHNVISLGGALGSDNLGDATNIGVGTLSIGSSFDNKQLSDDKYTDLGSKKIGVKG